MGEYDEMTAEELLAEIRLVQGILEFETGFAAETMEAFSEVLGELIEAHRLRAAGETAEGF